MSEVETALTGAEVAPVENTATTPEQTQASTESTTEQVDNPEQNDKPRDEKGRFVPQERVNEITRARREAERERDYWRTQAEQRQQAASSQPNTQGDEAPPSPADFNWDMEKFGAALTQYAVRNVEKKFQHQSQQQQQQAIEQQFEKRSQEYAKAHPEFDQAVDELTQAVRFHPAIVEAIGLNERGPEILHHLSQHLDEADSLSRMSPLAAAVQIGRIEAKLATPRPKPVTNAPNPPPTLSGGKAAITKNPDEMSQAEWLAWRQSSLKKQQGR